MAILLLQIPLFPRCRTFLGLGDPKLSAGFGLSSPSFPFFAQSLSFLEFCGFHWGLPQEAPFFLISGVPKFPFRGNTLWVSRGFRGSSFGAPFFFFLGVFPRRLSFWALFPLLWGALFGIFPDALLRPNWEISLTGEGGKIWGALNFATRYHISAIVSPARILNLSGREVFPLKSRGVYHLGGKGSSIPAARNFVEGDLSGCAPQTVV